MHNHYCLVFELLHEKPVLDYFLPEDCEPKLKVFAMHLLKSLCFLNQQNLIHADLKPENLLLKHEDDLTSLRLIDFGNSHREIHSQKLALKSNYEVQPLLYRAPEVMFGLPYGLAIDMWSFGCIIAELFLGKPLFCGANSIFMLQGMAKLLGPLPREIFRDGKFYNKLHFFTKDCQQKMSVVKLMEKLKTEDYHLASFIAGCLKFNPEERLTPFEAVRHPFLAQYGISFLSPPTDNTPRRINTMLPSTDEYPYAPLIECNVNGMTSEDILRSGGTAIDRDMKTSQPGQVVPIYIPVKTRKHGSPRVGLGKAPTVKPSPSKMSQSLGGNAQAVKKHNTPIKNQSQEQDTKRKLDGRFTGQGPAKRSERGAGESAGLPSERTNTSQNGSHRSRQLCYSDSERSDVESVNLDLDPRMIPVAVSSDAESNNGAVQYEINSGEEDAYLFLSEQDEGRSKQEISHLQVRNQNIPNSASKRDDLSKLRNHPLTKGNTVRILGDVKLSRLAEHVGNKVHTHRNPCDNGDQCEAAECGSLMGRDQIVDNQTARKLVHGKSKVNYTKSKVNNSTPTKTIVHDTIALQEYHAKHHNLGQNKVSPFIHKKSDGNCVNDTFRVEEKLLPDAKIKTEPEQDNDAPIMTAGGMEPCPTPHQKKANVRNKRPRSKTTKASRQPNTKQLKLSKSTHVNNSSNRSTEDSCRASKDVNRTVQQSSRASSEYSFGRHEDDMLMNDSSNDSTASGVVDSSTGSRSFEDQGTLFCKTYSRK